MHFFRHTFQNNYGDIIGGCDIGCAQAHPAHPVAPPMLPALKELVDTIHDFSKTEFVPCISLGSN
jgi:hypothetical protein